MDTSQLTKILGDYPLFVGLSEVELHPLLAGHKFRNIPHHEILYKAGDTAENFAIVLTGAFKLVRATPRGEDAIVYFATPGDVIGGLVMLKQNAVFPVSAIALGASTVLAMPKNTYLEAWISNAKVQAKLNSALYSRMSVLQESQANSKLTLQQRVAALLLNLVDKQPSTESSRIPIPLTRQEIADSVGSTVESVIRCMSDLSQQGIIQTENQQIEILRTDKIVDLLKNL